MLKGISPLVSPELLKVLSEMGHGDELVLSDAHFPGYSNNTRVMRQDGATVTQLIEAILPLWELDQYAPPLVMMAPEPGDAMPQETIDAYAGAVAKATRKAMKIELIDRQSFYLRTRSAYAVVITGETRKYGNLLLKKGVIA